MTRRARLLRSVVPLSALMVVAISCKQATESTKQYPIIDERGDTPLVGSLAGEVQNPFDEKLFDESSCTPQSNLGNINDVHVRLNIDEVSDNLNVPRQAFNKVVEVPAAFSLQQGRLSARWLDAQAMRAGEVAVGKLNLGEYASKQEGIAAAYTRIDNENFNTTVLEAAKPLMLCSPLAGQVADLTAGQSRMHAALGMAALLGNEVQYLESYIGHGGGSGLFASGFRVAPFGLNLLNELYVDYSFVAPNAEGVKTRFYQRYAAADNLAFFTNFQYNESFSGSKLRATRRFVAMPHSRVFAEQFLGTGAFYKTPFALQHEFAHLVFAESVRRNISVTLKENGFSFMQAALYVPKLLLGVESEQFFNDIRYGSGRRVQALTEPLHAVQRFDLLTAFPNDGRLSSDDKRELVRRVEYVMRGLEEGVADLYALARSANYSGFRLGCIGTNRDPRVNQFGVGNTTTQTLKRIPAALNLTDFLANESSWQTQALGTGFAVLAERGDCSARPFTLQSPYALASIFTAWLHTGLTQMLGMPFSQLSEAARMELVMQVIASLKATWGEWTAMMSDGYQNGRFNSFADFRSNEELLTIAKQVSLQNTISALVNSVFSDDSNGWVRRYQPHISPAAVRVQLLQQAIETGFLKM